MLKKFLIVSIFSMCFSCSSFAANEYFEKAVVAVDEKNEVDTVFYYKKSIEVYPKEIKAYVGLAQVRLAQKDYIKALTNLLKAKDIDENNYDVNYYLGEYHHKRANFYQSIRYYEKAQKIRLDKDEPLWVKMGKTYEKLGDVKKAKTAYINALSLNNQNKETLDSLKKLDKLEQKQEYRY